MARNFSDFNEKSEKFLAPHKNPEIRKFDFPNISYNKAGSIFSLSLTAFCFNPGPAVSVLHELEGVAIGNSSLCEKARLSFSCASLDCKKSLFCSKIPAGGAARKRVRHSSREPRVVPPNTDVFLQRYDYGEKSRS